jgi:predicted  nucleic acid-binding Zn-ribbon protein
MGELYDNLGNKAAGYLVKSNDWNNLVQAVENNQTGLSAANDQIATLQSDLSALSDTVTNGFVDVNTRIDVLESKVDTVKEDLERSIQDLSQNVDEKCSALDAKIDALKSDFDAFVVRIDPFFKEYYRLTMETGQLRYTIGQLAEVTARVTDLQKNPLDLTDAGSRPWIDFVASWGQLKPVPGYQTRGGVGDRTLSVQVDEKGQAKVLLRSEFADGFSEEEEEEVSTSLTTTLAAVNMSVANTILQAATPLEAKDKGAFKALSEEYDRTDAVSVRKYVDVHYLRNPTLVTGKLTPIFTHRWRDHRATVMAFAKSDSDPRTPDQSRGVSSIQITFRDWIGPWAVMDFFKATTTRVEDTRKQLNPRITGKYLESVGFLKEEVENRTRDKGVVGKLREYKVLREAMDQVTGAGGEPPVFLNKLTRTMKDAIDIQHALEGAQASAVGAPDQSKAFQAFTNAAVRSDTDVSEFSKDIEGITSRVDEVDQKIQQQVSQAVSNNLADLEKPGGAIDSIKNSVQDVRGQVIEIQKIGRVDEVQNKLTKIDEVSRRLDFFMAKGTPPVS